MNPSSAAYAVGWGKPPLHTRFQKGQSGNPSGKPGPAKLARQRLQRALHVALDASPEELERLKPEDSVAAMAKRMALDAVVGRISALRMVLSLLDKECESDAQIEEQEFRQKEMELFSLLQGKMQGNEKSLDEILWPDDPDFGRPSVPAPVRNGAQPLSLLQGKKQGSKKNAAEQICFGKAPVAAAATSSPGRLAQLMTSSAAISLGNNARFATPPPGR